MMRYLEYLAIWLICALSGVGLYATYLQLTQQIVIGYMSTK